MDEGLSLLPGESGSVAELLGSVEGLAQAGSGEPTDAVNATAMTAAFHFTGTTPSANGATMQEYFIQSTISSAQQYDLLTTRLRGLSRDWCEICDQEIVLRLGSDPSTDLGTQQNVTTRTGTGGSNTSTTTISTAAHSAANPSVHVRVRRSLLANTGVPTDRRSVSVLRYLGALETDKLVARRSCLEIPATGPLMHFLHELGFETQFNYVAEGQMFIRGRVKACVYSLNEVTQFDSLGAATGSAMEIGFVGDQLPKEWRRICPRSWLIEISAVGCPADESLQDEVSDFADLLYPVVTPSKIDPSLFMQK